MTVKLNNLSAATREAMLQAELAKASAYAAPYTDLAVKAAQRAAELATSQTETKNRRTSLWDTFKQALSLAQNAGHSPATMRLGLEIACTNAEVPAGSFRSYVNTLGDLLNDVQNGRITVADAEKLSIADARKRYRKATPMQTAVASLMAAIKDYTAEEVVELAKLAAGEADEDIAIELVAIGQKHAEERQQQEEQAQGQNVDQRQAA